MSRKNRERAWSRFHAVPKAEKPLQLTNAYTEKYARELAQWKPVLKPDGLYYFEARNGFIDIY